MTATLTRPDPMSRPTVVFFRPNSAMGGARKRGSNVWLGRGRASDGRMRNEGDGRPFRPPCYYPYRSLRRGLLHRSPANSCSEEGIRLPALPSGIVTVRPVTGTDDTTGLGRR